MYQTLPEMASAYLIGPVQNHSFENGNKRVGFAAVAIFLRMNGLQLTLSEEQAIDLTVGIATGELEREVVVELIRSNVRNPFSFR